MENEGWTRNKICHWCGKTYKAELGDQRRRFCSAACKQAHHRAYKKYVTAKRHVENPRYRNAVTPKKRKKRKKC